jgi:hypothetical protein
MCSHLISLCVHRLLPTWCWTLPCVYWNLSCPHQTSPILHPFEAWSSSWWCYKWIKKICSDFFTPMLDPNWILLDYILSHSIFPTLHCILTCLHLFLLGFIDLSRMCGFMPFMTLWHHLVHPRNESSFSSHFDLHDIKMHI